jgi:glycosyltransferase involved in cell wall biosynthesis
LHKIRKPNKVDTIEEVQQGISDFHPEYQGRTCQGCEAFTARPSKYESTDADLTIIHLGHRENWQDQLKRSSFALAQHGVTVRGIELVKPSERRVREVIAQTNPHIVFNHGFVGVASTMIRLAKDYPNTTVVNVDHSNQNHTFTWPHYFREMRQVLEASETVPNCWMASPDAYMPWKDLGYQRYVHWPNPVYLPPCPSLPVPLHDPPTLVIVGRLDWMKAFPAQIGAAALVQRQRPLRVLLVFNGDEKRKAGLYEHARACKLAYEVPKWMGHEQWYRFLRDESSVICQTSMSESFNYVSLDAASFGRPFVGAPSIRHTPDEWLVIDPNDCFAIADRIHAILDDYPTASRTARTVAEAVAQRNNREYAKLVKQLSPVAIAAEMAVSR